MRPGDVVGRLELFVDRSQNVVGVDGTDWPEGSLVRLPLSEFMGRYPKKKLLDRAPQVES